jgi:hypothetical protein
MIEEVLRVAMMVIGWIVNGFILGVNWLYGILMGLVRGM